jgi:hypothetical protein
MQFRQNRHDFIDAHKARVRKATRADVAKLLVKHVKASLIAKGLIPDPKTRGPKRVFGWFYEGRDGIVRADTRSHARGLIKVELGIPRKKRLPIKVQITELNENPSRGVGAA